MAEEVETLGEEPSSLKLMIHYVLRTVKIYIMQFLYMFSYSVTPLPEFLDLPLGGSPWVAMEISPSHPPQMYTCKIIILFA